MGILYPTKMPGTESSPSPASGEQGAGTQNPETHSGASAASSGQDAEPEISEETKNHILEKYSSLVC